MGNYENLKQSITEVIRTNGNQEITGAVLQSTLLTIISTVGANATFAGIATPTTNPGTPDGPVFYLASEGGTYSNFNAIELQDGLSVLMWNGSWSSQQLFSVNCEDVLDRLAWVYGYVDNSGIIRDSSQFTSFRYIKLKIINYFPSEEKHIITDVCTNAGGYIAFFDSNDELISSINKNTISTDTISIPDNSDYVLITNDFDRNDKPQISGAVSLGDVFKKESFKTVDNKNSISLLQKQKNNAWYNGYLDSQGNAINFDGFIWKEFRCVSGGSIITNLNTYNGYFVFFGTSGNIVDAFQKRNDNLETITIPSNAVRVRLCGKAGDDSTQQNNIICYGSINEIPVEVSEIISNEENISKTVSSVLTVIGYWNVQGKLIQLEGFRSAELNCIGGGTFTTNAYTNSAYILFMKGDTILPFDDHSGTQPYTNKRNNTLITYDIPSEATSVRISNQITNNPNFLVYGDVYQKSERIISYPMFPKTIHAFENDTLWVFKIGAYAYMDIQLPRAFGFRITNAAGSATISNIDDHIYDGLDFSRCVVNTTTGNSVLYSHLDGYIIKNTLYSKKEIDVNRIELTTHARPNGVNKKVLIISDSYFDQLWGAQGIWRYLKDFVEADGNTITFKGTRTSYSGMLGEARGGWSAHKYLTYYVPSSQIDPSLPNGNGYSSPFVFSTDDTVANSYFSFSKYMTDNNIGDLDAVVISLGKNYTNNDAEDIESMIDNIREDYPSLKIFVVCQMQEPMAYRYNGGVGRNLEHDNQVLSYIKKFDNRDSEYIYTIPLNLSCHPANCCWQDGVKSLAKFANGATDVDENVLSCKMSEDTHPSSVGQKTYAWMIYTYVYTI